MNTFVPHVSHNIVLTLAIESAVTFTNTTIFESLYCCSFLFYSICILDELMCHDELWGFYLL